MAKLFPILVFLGLIIYVVVSGNQLSPVPSPADTSPTPIPYSTPLPTGCVYQQVQCIKAPCDPILVCTTPIPSPKNPPKTTQCKTAGCSSELCVDVSSPDIASVCIYKDEYACLKYSICEPQANGECGWTTTVKYQTCLAGVGSLN
jgi:eight-cysteine-cluster-containing protein